MLEQYEQRSEQATRAAITGGRRAVGHAAVFQSRTTLAPGIFEEVNRGAFRESLLRDDVRMTVNHDPSALLARTGAGTLHLEEDSRGLAFNAELPDTTLGRDVEELLRRGDLAHASFRFRVPAEDRWTLLSDGSELRSLLKLSLLDVSLVSYPAYPDATAALRSRDAARESLVIPVRIVQTHRLLGMRNDPSDGRR